MTFSIKYWLVVWNHGILWLSTYWECHHPNQNMLTKTTSPPSSNLTSSLQQAGVKARARRGKKSKAKATVFLAWDLEDRGIQEIPNMVIKHGQVENPWKLKFPTNDWYMDVLMDILMGKKHLQMDDFPTRYVWLPEGNHGNDQVDPNWVYEVPHITKRDHAEVFFEQVCIPTCFSHGFPMINDLDEKLGSRWQQKPPMICNDRVHRIAIGKWPFLKQEIGFNRKKTDIQTTRSENGRKTTILAISWLGHKMEISDHIWL